MYRNNPYTPRGNFRTGRPSGFKMNQLTSKQKLLFLFVSTCGMGLWFLTPASDYIADMLLMFVPIDSDVELGKQALYSLARDSQLRPAVDRFGVEQAGWELVTASGADKVCPRCQWNFGVVKADYLNAFALPGGVVRVTDKLASILSTAEIKALIGHEIGHVLRRHSQRRMIKQNVLHYVISALIYEDNDGYSESFGEAVGEIMLKSAKFLGEQGFSRRDEYEADNEGWHLLSRSHIDPRAMITMLKKLWQASGDSGETHWESTHPGTKDRINALEKKWEAMSPKERQQFEKRRTRKTYV